jgi:hypothetical protein
MQSIRDLFRAALLAIAAGTRPGHGNVGTRSRANR